MCSMAAVAAKHPEGDFHIIGHSTGGLDARLLLMPGVELEQGGELEPLAARVRSLVSVSTPHLGTPLADFFDGMMGKKLLKLLSVLTMHGIRLGSIPIPALVALAEMMPGADFLIKGSIVDQIYRDLLRDFDEERQEQISHFFEDVASDQTLLTQLTPAAMDLFHASTAERPGVRYGCVISRARTPRLFGHLRVGLSPTNHAMYGLFDVLHHMGEAPSLRHRPLEEAQRQQLIMAYGELPDHEDNDAIVPTLSQVHGEVVDAAWGDHLDLIGHFNDLDAEPPHIDWLKTLSNFDRPRFLEVWGNVLDFSLRS